MTELSAKLNDMWEQAEYAAERKQLEEQYQVRSPAEERGGRMEGREQEEGFGG